MKTNKITPELPFVLSLEDDLTNQGQINNTEPITEVESVEKVFYSVGGQTNKEIVAEFENWINQSGARYQLVRGKFYA